MRRLRSTASAAGVLSAAAILLTVRAQPAAGVLFGECYWRGGIQNCKGDQDSKRMEEFVDGCLRCHGKNRCHWGDRPIEIPSTVVYAERLWEVLLAFAGTLELLVRGFTLGFGVRMLKYLFFEDDDGGSTTNGGDRTAALRSFRRRAAASAVAGLSLAAFLHGSSVFVPAQLREEWFSHGMASERGYDTSLPRALYERIRNNSVLHVTELRAEGADDLVCPSQCDSEDCDYTTANYPAMDWTDYALGRIGTSLVYLATTLEVLFRGFSLGFGARMLKFLFSRDGENDGIKNNDNSHLIDSFRHRATVSALAGISVAATLHGSSFFVPAQLRDQWFR